MTVRRAVVAAVVVALIGLVGCSDEAEPAPPVSSLLRGAGSCLPNEVPLEGARGVPLGAVAVRLCDGGGYPFQAPHDVLTDDLDALADLVNNLPEEPSPTACQDDWGTGYRLQFEYADDRVQIVSGDLYGCRLVQVGDTHRADPQRLYDEVLERFRDERAEREPAAPDPRLGCPDVRSGTGIEISLLGEPAEMVRAVLCVEAPDGIDRTKVPEADLRTMLDAYRATGSTCDYEVPRSTLVGSTAWGDVVVQEVQCEPAGGDDRAGLDPAAAPVLRRLVAEATSER